MNTVTPPLKIVSDNARTATPPPVPAEADDSVPSATSQQAAPNPAGDHGLDADRILRMLEGFLAVELMCHLRYLQHAFRAEGLAAEPAVAEFREHADQELGHARKLAARISQLGGDPSFRPATIERRSGLDWERADALGGMLLADLRAERHAVESYRKAIQQIAHTDPTTRRLLEDILADEERHADELASMLTGFQGIAAESR